MKTYPYLIVRTCSIIAYILLCSYSPFRGEDIQEMIRETIEATIEFNERYWSKVSDKSALLTGSAHDAEG
ncbi:hypothetical protein K503DRAFT_742607 [Rhizopogon vinicolor AM-OR11-026]|uniref:Uncharacterized protein n=1 Tax=Rhizopogon vinicolor AM-OR11-026 TaxID=1314800 RepID=A0A1B7MY57_9AGAM|nr:hypothetical protein K503DRAFT_742607 [Rhizopogon vinicolor AM-OR11-026]